MLETHFKLKETNFRLFSKTRGFSQKEFAKNSGISLRTIQLYEHKQNDLNRAQVATIKALTRTLG